MTRTFAPFQLVQRQDLLKKLAVVLVNSPIVGPFPPADDWARIWNGAHIRLCTDGAANRLREPCRNGHLHAPELIVGDFDSISDETRQFFADISTLRHVTNDQDTTDLRKTLNALNGQFPSAEQRRERLSGVLLLGGFHGRFDHVFSTLVTLLSHVKEHESAPDGLPFLALDQENVLVVLPEGETRVVLDTAYITGTCGIFGSLPQKIPRVSTAGLKWNLDDVLGSYVTSSNHAVQPENLRVKCCDSPTVFMFELREPNRLLPPPGGE